MRDVFNYSILMIKPIRHFFLHVGMILFELPDGVLLDKLDPLSLTQELLVQLLGQQNLALLAALLLCGDGIFDDGCFILQQFEYFSLFCNSGRSFIIHVFVANVNLGNDWLQLSVKGLNSIFLLLVEELFELLHPVIASLDL